MLIDPEKKCLHAGKTAMQTRTFSSISERARKWGFRSKLSTSSGCMLFKCMKHAMALNSLCAAPSKVSVIFFVFWASLVNRRNIHPSNNKRIQWLSSFFYHFQISVFPVSTLQYIVFNAFGFINEIVDQMTQVTSLAYWHGLHNPGNTFSFTEY